MDEGIRMRQRKALKSALLESGIRQRPLARRIGISEGHLSSIVNGWKIPDENLKQRIAEELNKDVASLFLAPMLDNGLSNT